MAMLDDIRILDLSRVLSGPYCSRMLADMGAEVIKVESLNGEPMRHYPPLKGNHSSYFTQWNVGKKSLCLDLRQKTAIDLIKKIVAKSDVVLQNFRPGTLEKMGLGYDELKAVNPKIILCSISGFGQTGCESKRLAYTDIVQAYSGLDYISGKMNNSDTDPQGFPVSFADTYASLNACVAILAALLHRYFDARCATCIQRLNASGIYLFRWAMGATDRDLACALEDEGRLYGGGRSHAIRKNCSRYWDAGTASTRIVLHRRETRG